MSGAFEKRTLWIKKLSEVADSASSLTEAHFPIFFRDDVQESLSPSWDEEGMFGRVDTIARYTNTKRAISFSFHVVALSGDKPGHSESTMFDNLATCTEKIDFLRSLPYPKFDNTYYTQPPLITMSLSGHFLDVMGYITDLTIDHQLTTGIGVDTTELGDLYPRMWTVSISFTILHSEPPSTGGLKY